MPVAEVISFPSAATRRLNKALAGLAEAQASQAVALADFRARMAELHLETTRLRVSTLRWQDDVRGVQAQVDRTRAAVRELEVTAARM